MHTRLIRRLSGWLLAVTLLVTAPPAAVSAAETNAPSVSESAWDMTVPQIRVTTENGNGTTLQKEDGYQQAHIVITDTDGSTLEDDCTIKVRGNTTALSWVTKKAYAFKFEKKKEVLGMGKGKKWVLIANTFDPTLLRNMTAFELAKELEIPYTSQYKVTELWVDDSFRGCYLLYVPVQVNKDRINLDIEGNDGKKDFMIEHEASRVEEDKTYFTTNGVRFLVSEPETPDEEQLAYMQQTMDSIIHTLRYGTREEVEAAIDVPSFAKYYLLNEYMKTYDFDMSSVFYYYKDGKLYAGPPWDYDLSSGNAGPDDTTRRARATITTDGLHANSRNIYPYVCCSAWFMDEVRALYREHYTFIADISGEGGLLDSLYAQYADVFARNYKEAGWNVGKWWINIQHKPERTYEANFAYLKNWCAARCTWMTGYYLPTAQSYMVGDADGDGQITISDVTQVQRLLAEFETDAAAVIRADVDQNGLNVNDATFQQKYLAHLETPYPIGKQRFVESQ